MSAKKIRKRRFVPDLGRVNHALRAIAENTLTYYWKQCAAAMPVWEFNSTVPMPGPDDANAPIPAIRPELVNPVLIITDPHVVADFEATGMPIARLGDVDQERVLLWVIDSRGDALGPVV